MSSFAPSNFSDAFINGKWVPSMSGAKFDVTNPANGEKIASVANCSELDAAAAVDAAYEAFKTWGFDTTAKQRGAILTKLFHLHVQHKTALGKLLTTEQGKPTVDSEGEIMYSASFLDWFAHAGRHINGEIVESPFPDRKILHFKEPIGVAGFVTPWNFPSAMIMRKMAAALAAGCTVVIKPAEDTPLSALAIAQLAQEAGLPDGVLNVIPADRQNTAIVGKFLCESPKVATISFTGSTHVGKTSGLVRLRGGPLEDLVRVGLQSDFILGPMAIRHQLDGRSLIEREVHLKDQILLKQSADTVKRVSLELGGNAAFIVFESADIDRAAQGLLNCKFRNGGQSCICANRVYVQSGIYDQFIQKYKALMEQNLKVGNGLDEGVNQGPVINDRAVQNIDSLVKDAVKKGGKVLLGGKTHALGGRFYEPTLVTNLSDDMRIAREEIFGPVTAIHKFETEAEVLRRANNVRVGLAGYFYSKDIGQIFRVARRLEVGIVGVNEGLVSTAEAGFGGVKESGLGRECSHFGMDEFLEVKYVCLSSL